MGIEDREWYKEAQRKRLEREYREMSGGGGTPIFRQRQPSQNNGNGPSLFAGVDIVSTVVKTIIYCLAIYGALHLALLYVA